MSTVIEPENDEPTGMVTGFCGWYGRYSIAALFSFLDWLAKLTNTNKQFSYDAEAKRLRLRGESEHSGNEIERVRALYDSMALHTYIWMLIALLATVGGGIVGFGESTSIVLPTILSMAIVMVFGGRETIKQTEIIDHTTQAVDDDRLDELASQYTNGDLTAEEHEQRVEQVLESEAEQ